MDKAILRFGRIDQRWKIPAIETVDDSRRLLERYLGEMYAPESNAAVERRLIGKPRVFVRELSFTARLRAAATGDTKINGHLKAALRALEKQVLEGEAFLREDKSPLGFAQREKEAADEFPF